MTILSDAFSWTKSFVFWLIIHWHLFLRVQWTITQHWFMAPNRRQAIIWTNADPIHRRIYASLGADALIHRYIYASVNLDNLSSDNGVLPFNSKPLSEPMMVYWSLQVAPLGIYFDEIEIEIHTFRTRKWTWEYRLQLAAILSQSQCVSHLSRRMVVFAKMLIDMFVG